MPAWFPRPAFGLVLVALHLAVSIFAVHDARTSQGGGWISLKGIDADLVTPPVSFPGETLSLQPDYRRNADMARAIGACAVLADFAGAGRGRLAPPPGKESNLRHTVRLDPTAP